MNRRDAQFLINFFVFIPRFIALHVSNELLVHHQEHSVIYCITQFGTIVQASLAALQACTIVPIVLCNTVYHRVVLMMND